MSFFKKWRERRASLPNLSPKSSSSDNSNKNSLDESDFYPIDNSDPNLPLITPLEPVEGQHPLASSDDNFGSTVKMGSATSTNSSSTTTSNSSSASSTSSSKSAPNRRLTTTATSSSSSQNTSANSSSSSNSIQSISYPSKDAFRWRTNTSIISRQPATASDSFTCPICAVILYTNDESAVNKHVDECLERALSKPHLMQSNLVAQSLPTSPAPNTTQPKPYVPLFPDSPATSPTITSRQTSSTSSSTSVSYNRPYSASTSSSSNSLSNIHKSPSQNNFYIDETNPFAMRCPYGTCGSLMEAKDFYDHVMVTHAKDPIQTFACPVCSLMGLSGFKVTKDTNLYRHVKNQHFELHGQSSNRSNSSTRTNNQNTTSTSTSSSSSSPKPYEIKDLPPDVVSMVDNLGSRYVVDTLKQDLDQECSICYEEFKEGDSIARMDCFCIFHRHCVEQWFKRSNKCPLHKD